MCQSTRTAGELAFEEYLKSQSLPFDFEKKHLGKSRVPDYCVEWNGSQYLFEVKDLESRPLLPAGGFRAVQPYKPIRKKINQCREKFKEYKEFCCAAVFFNNGALAMLEQPEIMLGSMYGDFGFRIPFDPDSGTFNAPAMQPAFLRDGKMAGGNTTISALITLTMIRPDFERVRAAKKDRSHEICGRC